MKIQGSQFKIKKNLNWLLLTVYCLLLTVWGCGYTMYGRATLPFDSIQIGTIENTTVEPKLQDKLYQSLTEEFLKQGIRISPDADYKLSGKINRFEMRILSEKSGIATEYEVRIKGDFQLVTPLGDIQEFKNIGSPFIVSFQSNDVLEDVIAKKEHASEKALRDMAMEIIANLIYR
jgi:outer membrane lipopolysaccharide assembly protein LptE/RlpB